MGAHTLIDSWWPLRSLKMPEKKNWRLGVIRKCRNYGYKLNIVTGEPDCARSICWSLAGLGVGMEVGGPKSVTWLSSVRQRRCSHLGILLQYFPNMRDMK